MMEDRGQTKRVLCLDFDGVLHNYMSGWQGADVISDPPVPGAMAFLMEAVHHFDVWVFSSRSHQEGGMKAMMDWLEEHLIREFGIDGYHAMPSIKMASTKPMAHVSLDDRAITFTGEWPSMETLKIFKPWNK